MRSGRRPAPGRRAQTAGPILRRRVRGAAFRAARTNQAEEESETQMPEINTGDTAWVLISAALVMSMTPALAFFYGGLVRQKNMLGTLMHSFFMLGLISAQWALWGYSFAFGPTMGGFIGAPIWLGLAGVGAEPNADYAATIPHLAFMA